MNEFWKEYNKSYTSKTTLAAIFFLCTIYEKLQEVIKLKNSVSKEFLQKPYDFRHSMSNIYFFLDECMSLPFNEAVEKIIIELALKLHLAVSQEKILSTGNFTFRFSRSDNAGFKWIDRIKYPNMTSNKLIFF